MRKRWDKIPRGICSLPIVTKGELVEHFKMIQKRWLKIVTCDITNISHPTQLSRKAMRKVQIMDAISKIEDECIRQGLRRTDDLICISRIRNGFTIWCIGYSLRMPLKDITSPEVVQVVISDDGKTVWINTEQDCQFRACRIKKLSIDDRRSLLTKVSSNGIKK